MTRSGDTRALWRKEATCPMNCRYRRDWPGSAPRSSSSLTISACPANTAMWMGNWYQYCALTSRRSFARSAFTFGTSPVRKLRTAPRRRSHSTSRRHRHKSSSSSLRAASCAACTVAWVLASKFDLSWLGRILRNADSRHPDKWSSIISVRCGWRRRLLAIAAERPAPSPLRPTNAAVLSELKDLTGHSKDFKLRL